MAFVAVPVTSGFPTSGYSSPERVSFCVSDDGGGGQVQVNGQGITGSGVSNPVDLQTLFGTAWRSTALLRAFRKVASNQLAADQFFQNLNIQILLMNGAIGLATELSIAPLWSLGTATDVPFLGIGGLSVAGIWRVDLQLRHSLPG